MRGEVERVADQLPTAAPAALFMPSVTIPDLVDAGALGGVDDVDDVPVAQRTGSRQEHRLVLALFEDVAQPLFELRQRDILVVDRDFLVGRVGQHDLADVGRDVGRPLGLGRQVDVDPLLGEVQGRHEDDQQHQQHVDQRRDVHVATGMRDFAGDDLVGAEVVMCVSHYWAPFAPPAVFFAVGHQADVLDPRLPELVHRGHHGGVLDFLVRLDQHHFLFLVLERVVDLGRQLAFPNRLGVQVEVLVRSDGDHRLVVRLRVVGDVVRRRQLDVDALLQQRRDQHHDDEQHQHDVNERRHVDVGFDSTLGAAKIH